MDIDALRGRNAYILLCNDNPIRNSELAASALNDVADIYLRLVEQRGWKTERLDASVSWGGNGMSQTLWVKGWEAYGVLSEEPDRYCNRYARPNAKHDTLEVWSRAYVVPETQEYEWKPFRGEVREHVFWSFASTGPGDGIAPAGVRLYHKPTGNGTDCREIERIRVSGRQPYILECNRKAAWSFLLHRLRGTDATQATI